MNMKKITAWILVIACISALSVGCGKKSQEEKPKEGSGGGTTTVTVWVNGGEDAYIPKVQKAFEKAHPEIKLDLLLVPQAESFQKIMTTISTGGELPDIVDINLDYLGQLLELDLWEDLSADPYNFDKNSLISYMPETLANSKGEMVALMADLTTCTVAYDRNLAKQYLGTDDPDELAAMFTETQDFIDYGKKVMEESGGTVYTFASAQDAWDMLYSQQVGEAFVVDGKLNIDDSIGGIFRFIEELQKNGCVNLYEQWGSEWVNNISDSVTMFYSCPLWFVDWGLATNDSVGGGRWGLMTPSSGATSGGENFLIPKSSADDKKQAAFTFLNWLCGTKEGADALYQEAGMISGYSGNLEEDSGFYETSNEAYGGQNTDGIFLNVAKMDSTRIRPLTKYDGGIFDSCTSVLIDLSQGMTAEDALKQVKEDLAGKYPELEIQ